MTINLPDKWNDYAFQYYKLSEKVLLKSPLPNDEYLPTIYISRHYVELRTKIIAKVAIVITGGSAASISGHDLSTLWNEAKPLIENALKLTSLFNTKLQNDLAAIETFIVNQTNWDSNSMALRYPYDRSNNPYSLAIDMTIYQQEWSNCSDALEYIYDLILRKIKSGDIVLPPNGISVLQTHGIEV